MNELKQLDLFLPALKQGDTHTLKKLINYLDNLKDQLTHEEWLQFIQLARKHPIKEIVLLDPFTYRSFTKPKGYSGDAVMMDMMYFPESFLSKMSNPISKEFFKIIAGEQKSPQAVRYRKEIIAKKINELLEHNPSAKILSVAAGHMREFELINSDFFPVNIYAVDQDKDSLDEIQTKYSSNGARTINLSIRGILSNKLPIKDFDLIYSLGLYDYLNDKIAARLTKRLFDLLKPDGKLIIANFNKFSEDDGYMEVYMDWFLIYRDYREILDFSREIPPQHIKEITLYPGIVDKIYYIEIVKK